jgi:protein-S-isoprenylcysteine O-methyltransferase Ste14
MSWLDTARYGVAWILVVALPAAIVYWFAVHPFAGVWRRIGHGIGIVAGFAVLGLTAFACGFAAPGWLRTEYGFSWPLSVLAVVFFGAAMWVQRQRKPYLTFRALLGIPQLSNDPADLKLFTEGIYSRIRHPRYVEVILGTLAYALFANYLAGYWIVAFTVFGILAVVWFEERDLKQRFGQAWLDYAAKTPRFIPRRAATVTAPSEPAEPSEPAATAPGSHPEPKA